jgi:hypothetical protein
MNLVIKALENARQYFRTIFVYKKLLYMHSCGQIYLLN